jgi:hypothetical protein
MIRYGSSKAGGGPGGTCEVGVVSESDVAFGDGAVILGTGDGALIGGGSMDEYEVDTFVGTAGSGRGGISPSADDVSSVMSFGGAAGAA